MDCSPLLQIGDTSVDPYRALHMPQRTAQD